MHKFLMTFLAGLLLALPLTASSPAAANGQMLSSNASDFFKSEPAGLTTPKRPPSAGEIKLRYARFDPLVSLPAAPKSLAPTPGVTKLQLVQFKGPILPSWRTALEAAGAQIYDYIPDYTFLVRLDAPALKTVASLPFVRWVGPFEPFYKLNTSLLAKKGRQELLVQALGDTSPEKIARAVTNTGGKLKTPTQPRKDGTLQGLQTLKLAADSAAVARLAALEEVVWLEEEVAIKADNSTAAAIIQSGQANEYPIWAQGITGAGSNPSSGATVGTEQIVAISDTGVDLGHGDFDGPAYPNATVLGLTNWGVGSGSPDPAGTDSQGHGTHVAGTIAGSGAGSGGESSNASYKGVAYGARLYVQQLGPSLNFLNDGSIASPIITLMSEAREKGARIQNNSWGAPTFGAYDDLARQADQFIAANPDFLGIWTVGNNGPSSGSVGSPGVAKNVLAVGATVNSAAGLNSLYNASSRGPTNDGRIRPDVLAPGACLVSAQSRTTKGYYCSSGTSMAAPTIAGAAALVREWYTQRQNYATPQSALLKATLINSTDYLPGLGDNLPSPIQGWGRVRLDNVLNPPAGRKFAYADNLQGLATGEDAYFTYQVTSSDQPLKISLAWTDQPAFGGASVQLVNDLDLYLIAPDGTSYLGNNFSGSFSNPGGLWDQRNNVEGVTVQKPATGTWKVYVQGFNVPRGPQPFALAAQGSFNCALPASFVTHTSDNTIANCQTGLRDALTASAPGTTVYLTPLPSGATIYPQTPLPPLKTGVRLLGFCSVSSGLLGQPSVRLDGSHLKANPAHQNTAGLNLTQGNSVRGLAIGNFPGDGLYLEGPDHNLRCNAIGTLDGSTPAPNANGITVTASVSNTTFGNPATPSDGNLISGNAQNGVLVETGATNIRFYANYLGYRRNGEPGLPNGGPGIRTQPGASIKLEGSNRVRN